MSQDPGVQFCSLTGLRQLQGLVERQSHFGKKSFLHALISEAAHQPVTQHLVESRTELTILRQLAEPRDELRELFPLSLKARIELKPHHNSGRLGVKMLLDELY